MILILPFALSLLFVHDRMTLLDEDGCSCMLLAKSLWSGGGYRSIWLEGSPVHVHFPPLLPLMLVPFWGLFGMHFQPAHFFMALWYALGCWLGYRLLRKRLSPLVAALWATFLATSPLYLESVSSVNSELPYTVLSLGGLLLIEDKEEISLKKWVAVLILFALSFYMRTISFTLFLTAALFYFLRPDAGDRTRKALSIAGASAVLMLPWTLWTHHGSGGNTYIAQFFMGNPYAQAPMMAGLGDITRRFGSNIFYYIGEISSLLAFELMKVRFMVPALFIVAAAVLTAVIFIGWWRWVSGRRSAAAIYTLLYFGPLMVWFWQYTRFLFPLIIPIGLCLAEGSMAIGERALGIKSRPMIERVLALFAAIMIIGNLVGIIHHHRQPIPPQIADFFAIHAPLRTAAAPDDVVVSRNHAITSLLTGLRTRSFTGVKSPGIALSLADGANWLILGELDEKTRASMEEMLRRYPDRFQLVDEKGPTRLYRIIPRSHNPASP